MTTDLWCVVAIALWGIALAYVPVTPRLMKKGGIAWGFGNRDGAAPEAPTFVGRADRAYTNHLANIAPFVALVLVAHVSGKHDEMTANASVAFVIARLLHAVFYVTGVTYMRTFAFWASLGALAVIVSRLV